MVAPPQATVARIRRPEVCCFRRVTNQGMGFPSAWAIFVQDWCRLRLRGFAPEHRTIDDAVTSHEQTMLERMRGAIAEANADADRLIASTGPAHLLADYANWH